MNFFKHTLLIAALFGINAINTRGPITGPTAPQAGAQQPAIQAPAAQQQTSGAVNYMALRNEIMNMGAAKVIDNSTNLLQDSFLNTIRSRVVDEIEFELFLQIARDKYLPLTGDDITDLQRLQAINNQIDQKVDQF